MKNSKIKKTFKKSVNKIFKKILKKKFFYFPKTRKSFNSINSNSKKLDYELKECESKISFKSNLELNKDDYLSDLEKYEIVKFLSFLEKSKNILLNHIDLEKEEDKELIGFKTEVKN